MACCDAQARLRMKPLLGETIESDKKFIPRLLVERQEVASRLADFLDGKSHRVTLLIGHPQVDRTNVVLHTRSLSSFGRTIVTSFVTWGSTAVGQQGLSETVSGGKTKNSFGETVFALGKSPQGIHVMPKELNLLEMIK